MEFLVTQILGRTYWPYLNLYSQYSTHYRAEFPFRGSYPALESIPWSPDTFLIATYSLAGQYSKSVSNYQKWFNSTNHRSKLPMQGLGCHAAGSTAEQHLQSQSRARTNVGADTCIFLHHTRGRSRYLGGNYQKWISFTNRRSKLPM